MRTGNGSDKSTQALVEDTIAGDSEAFARLVDRYRDAASAVAYSYLGGFDDVQDAVQEAFVHAYCNLRQLREPAKFGPWLRRIAANSCAMALRKRERSNVSLDEVAEQPSASDDAHRIAARAVVREALGKLSDATRLTVTLSYINGYSHAEIAEFLEVPLTTVRSRLRHAKRKLREEMIEMVEDVLHEDKPGEELAHKILEYAKRMNNATMVVANDEALRLCDEALAAIHDLSKSRTPEEFRVLLVRGVESEDDFHGDKERALHNLRTWTVEEITVREEVEILLKKGEVLLRLEDVEGTKRLFEQAVELIRGINNGEVLGNCVATIADIYLSHHQRALGREYLTQRIEIAGEAGDTIGEAMNTWALATTYLEDAQPVLARPFFERACALFAEANKPGFAVMGQAMLDLIDEVGEERWGSVVEWLVFCLPLVKMTGGIERATDRGGGCTSKMEEPIPHLTVLWGAERYWGMDGSKAPGTAWSESSHWRIPREWPVTTTITVVGYNESVTVPAGTFPNCMLIQEVTVEDGPPPESMSEAMRQALRSCVFGTRRYWFARGVGLVRFATRNIAGDETVVELNEYEMVEPGNDYLPLAVGNSWTYGWADAPQDYIAKERYRVAANEGEHWYLENYRYVLKA